MTYAKKGHAHSHGEIKMQIAFEETQGLIEWQVASDAIIGFEHKGKNEAQKQIIKQQLEQLRTTQSSLYMLPSLCQISSHQVEQVFANETSHAAHSEIQVSTKVNCQQPIKGSELGFKIQSLYPKINRWIIQQDTPSGSQQLKSKKDPQLKL